MQPSARIGVLASLLLALGATACAGADEPTADEVAEELSEQLQDGGFEAEAADCVAEVVVDELGVERVQDVDFGAEEPPEDLREDIAAAVVVAAEECELPAPAE
jgi:hypothetical protein